MKIAFLGPEGSYSHLSAELFLQAESKEGEKGVNFDECIPFRNFLEVLNAVSSGRVDAATIPIENSLQGGVSQNLDLLQASMDLYAVSEQVIKIDHRLIYKEGVTLSQIGRVYSHRQALDQCFEFLSKQCASIDSILKDKQEQLEKIKQHKKSLIYEYVTGKKRVKEATNGN